MTNKEAAIATLQITGYPESALTKALEDSNLNGEEDYTSNNKESVNAIAVEVLQGMLLVSSVSEGGYSVTYSVDMVKARLTQLGAGSTVKAANVW